MILCTISFNVKFNGKVTLKAELSGSPVSLELLFRETQYRYEKPHSLNIF